MEFRYEEKKVRKVKPWWYGCRTVEVSEWYAYEIPETDIPGQMICIVGPCDTEEEVRYEAGKMKIYKLYGAGV
jgi:hypothetical protein